MPIHDGRFLETARIHAGLTRSELWLRYFELGGRSSPPELDAFLHGARTPTPHDHDLLVHALNERFREQGRDHPLPYAKP
ncbi:MAG TPA: hypothetical protein VFP54_05365 [Acidimicrobiales bacterium]|nr:hypothetical protein [Acidimicrobiales bacterium]